MAKLVEGEDYYLENGYLVFTEAYHLGRGHCCGSGCRHCPYLPKREPDDHKDGERFEATDR
jgi:hypothetical protein